MKLRASFGLLAAIFAGVFVCLALPPEAHAGFGRRGSSSSHSGGGGRSHSAPSRSFSSGSGGFGRASSHSGFTTSRRDHARGRSGGYVPSRSWGWSAGYGYPVYPRAWGFPVWGYGFGYVPSYPVYAVDQPALTVEGQPTAAEPAIATALAGDMTLSSAGGLFGAQLSIEGQTLGFVLGYTAALPSIDGTGQTDTLHLALAHLTFAFFSSERARLRGEVGMHLAAAPLVTFVAPGAGLSAALGLVGPLGLEARVYGNVWPYTQVDARAGLTVSFSGVGIGAGVRALYLNDNGVLGEVNAGDTSDTFIGPYATLAFAL